MIAYIDEHKEEFGVEPICTVLSEADAKIAPSSYYAAKSRPPSARAVADTALDQRIEKLYEENYRVYGVRKMWKTLNRQLVLDEHGVPTGEKYPPVARCTVARRMTALGLRGAVAGDHTKPRTTIPAADQHPEDLVNRDFTAQAPDTRWVADITYVPTWAGFVYVAFVLDLFSRRIVGWRVSASLRTDLALDALEQAIWTRQREGSTLNGLIHHADRGVQYRAIRYTERLEELGITASVGSKGDSYDNAAAEALNRLFKPGSGADHALITGLPESLKRDITPSSRWRATRTTSSRKSFGYALGMVHILSRSTSQHHRLGVTYPCSSPDRHAVECGINKLKQYRAFATRYDNLAVR